MKNLFIALTFLASGVVFAANSEINKRGPECLDGSQTTLSDIKGSYYNNPLSKAVFCYSDSAGKIVTMFGDLNAWSNKATQKMHKSATLECHKQDRIAFVVQIEQHPSYTDVYKTNSYICMNKSELDFSLAHGYFMKGAPEKAEP